MTDALMTDVLIVGAGPAGLLLAAELRLAGVDTVVVERHAQRPPFCRGFNLNARSLDLLARRGLADGLVGEGWRVPHAPVSGLPVTLGLAGTHTGHPFSLGIPQTRVEEVLEEHALGRGADIRRGHELRALQQDSESVTATVATGDGEYRVRAAYLVGCDGGRSTVRRQAGIGFPGTEATRFSLLGDVELTDPEALPFGVTTGPGGAVLVIPRPGYVRIITADPRPPADKDAPVTLDLLQAAAADALGRHVGLRSARWLTRFGDAARQAAEYVRGRVVLAGDAAHIHPPAGAIGVNVALDDAFNLGWKLAACVRGTAPAHLLDSYHTERHTAGAHVLANTRAQVLLGEADDRLRPLTDLLARVASHPAGNRALAETVTGLSTRYRMTSDADHPWLGRLAPDLALTTADGRTRLAGLLASGRGLLLDLTGGRAVRESAAGWADRVDLVTAACPGHPDLHALLLRPDGHTAWLSTDGRDDAEGLPHALQHWYGPAASSEAAFAAPSPS
ncbi:MULTISPECIES: FAD-dependent monooxygenase [unclassified Streptomyces]|uniref:FAD-dependent monooxygenase n=1 Tax=unclassified Streptomyces TaxID=2593676 RepID=UPI00026DEFC3|nr:MULTISPECIES: FAD-dependent monooxygenase [unclassified Streptomyces]AFO53535.1 monooxygenase [Streptomyces sp. WAC 01438]AZM58329.1 monooxygenase [Streptomyces sp. WAC 01438]RSM88837.1 monooxygenase [Streptomyces sp. WAC 01420]